MATVIYYVYGVISVLLINLTGVFAPCSPACQNGGFCDEVNNCPGGGGSGASPPCCSCAGTGYQGMICEISVQNQQCPGTSCLNGGICNNGMCDCTATDYFGGLCEFKKALVGFSDSMVTFTEGQGRESVRIQRMLFDGQTFDTTVNIMVRTDMFKAGHQAILTQDFNNVDANEEFRNTDPNRNANFELINDDVAEGDEYFQLELSIAQGSQSRAMLDATRSTALVKINGGDGTQGCNSPLNSCNNGQTCNADGSCSNCDIPFTSVTCSVIPLAIQCPSDVSVFSSTGQSVLVTYNLPTASGGTPPYTTSCNPASNSNFGVGNYNVVCSVTDQAMTRTCTFTVVVTGPTGCNTSPCLNSGNCVTVGTTGFTCSCINSWTGTTCTDNECMSPNIVCQNGGSCKTDPNTGAFTTCEPCSQGFSGVKCETGPTQPTGCNTSPCLNSGTCVTVGATGYTCNCVNSWTGTTCTDNECTPGNIVCQNGGSCKTDLTTGAFTTCEPCSQGFSGVNCETATMVTAAPGSGSGQNGGNPDNNNNPQPGGLSNNTIIAIGAAVGGLVLIIIFVIIVILLLKRRARRKPQTGPTTRQKHRRDNTYADNVALQQRHDRKPNRPRPQTTAPRPAAKTEKAKTEKAKKGNKTHKQATRPPRAQTVPGKGMHRRTPTVYEKSERKIGTEFPRRSLKLHEHLGSGAFANVVRASAMGVVKRRVNTVVAVKMLKEMATDSDKSDFMKELQVYRMLEPHPNIIVMLGHCTEKEPYYLIMEYAPHGNLQNYLRDIRNAPDSPYNNVASDRRDFLTPGEILQFGSQIATGMKYLASKQCIHRDLATRNVLLGDGLVCKLSDFGLARELSQENAYEMQSKGRVPVRWMALESLLENTYTSKSDVWSFGITLWELVTLGSHPYPGKSSKRVLDELKKGYRLPKPEHCSDEIYTLMKECWKEKPENRPSFVQLSKKLERMLDDANGYLTMTNFDTATYVYLDPDNPDGSSIESGDFNSPYSAGIV